MANDLFEAAGALDPKPLKEMLSKGADPNQRTKDGEYPIQNAAYWGRTVNVLSLIQEGADINVRSPHNLTPLHYAVQQDKHACVDVLIKAGAELNLLDREQQTPLHAAAYKGHADCVRLLIEAGADINIRDEDGLLAVALSARARAWREHDQESREAERLLEEAHRAEGI